MPKRRWHLRMSNYNVIANTTTMNTYWCDEFPVLGRLGQRHRGRVTSWGEGDGENPAFRRPMLNQAPKRVDKIPIEIPSEMQGEIREDILDDGNSGNEPQGVVGLKPRRTRACGRRVSLFDAFKTWRIEVCEKEHVGVMAHCDHVA